MTPTAVTTITIISDEPNRKLEMLALSNPFYQNPEANARQLLQQQMLSDAQRGFHQSLAELFALRSLLFQGQVCLCIPLNGFALGPTLPGNFQVHPHPHHSTQHHQKPQEPAVTKETKLYVTLRNENQKKVSALRTEECKLKAECVEIVVNLREVLPAEICVAVDERAIRVEVNRVDREGVKNVWRHYDLPACIQVEAAKCILSHDGFLHISVPWCKMES